MNGHITISRKDEKEDLYLHLQEAALQYVQRSSGEVWSDYNEHDPGVTLLDALNYVLLETDYRFRFELLDYLASPRNGYLPSSETGFRPETHALFSPSQVFSVNPVTADDYRRLFLTSIDVLRNVWVLPRNGNGVGIYDIILRISPERTAEQRAKIVNEVRQVYQAHRNLCEQIGWIRFQEEDLSEQQSGSLPEQESCKHSDEEVAEIRRQYCRQETNGATPETICRLPFVHAPVFDDLPACYHSAVQLKSYLHVFDSFIEYALNELEELPHWMQLQLSGLSDKKAVWLDMLDKLYGTESNPEYLRCSESVQENRVRRIAFLADIPRWGHDRGRAADLSDFVPESISGLESYIVKLFNLPKYGLEIYLIEHCLLVRDSQTEEPFTVSVILSATDDWLTDDDFRQCCEEAVAARLPAHIRLHLYWQDKNKLQPFRNNFYFWRYALSTKEKIGFDELSDKLKKYLKDDQYWYRKV